jgi:predicted Zn-dependent protease
VALRRAIELDANNPYAVQYLAILLVEKGRADESLQMSHQLAMANPVSSDFQRAYANILFRAHKYDDSIVLCRRIIDLDPNHLITYGTLANALVQTGRYHEAEIAFEKGNLFNPGVQAWLYALEGNPQAARQILKDNPTSVNVHTAMAHYLVGDREAGLTELGELTDRWDIKTYHLINDPTFDPMRNDPRFAEIVKRSSLLDN